MSLIFWRKKKSKLEKAKIQIEKASANLFVAQVKYKYYLDLEKLKKK